MQFGMTIPMQKFFHMGKPPYGEKIEDLFCWELHVISIQGRNCQTAAVGRASECRSDKVYRGFL